MFEMLFWVFIAFALIVVDLITSSFVFMWFSIGALINILLSMFNVPFLYQVIVFFAVGICMVIIGYPWVKRKIEATCDSFKPMEENYIGKVMRAESDIDDTTRIKVGGIYWTACNTGELIKQGESFIITGIDGNKLEIKLKER